MVWLCLVVLVDSYSTIVSYSTRLFSFLASVLFLIALTCCCWTVVYMFVSSFSFQDSSVSPEFAKKSFVEDPSSVLLLSAVGVLFVPPLPALFSKLELLSVRSFVELEEFYVSSLRDSLWDGSLFVEGFWRQLLEFAGLKVSSKIVDELQEEFLGFQMPLMLPSSLVELHDRFSQLWVLSNHRECWLRPALDAAGFSDVIDGLLVSSATSFVKPDPHAFLNMLDVVDVDASQVTFVDDSEVSVAVASLLGFSTVLADPGGLWVDQLL